MDNEQPESSRNVDRQLQEIFGFDSGDDPFQDSGSDYQPSERNSSTSTTDLLDILSDENQPPNNTNSEVIDVQNKPRKRVRQHSKWKKNMRKVKRSRDDWVEVIKAARDKNPFSIIKMTKDDFFSTKKLESNITNRKVTAEKSKVAWLKIQWLLFNKMHPFTIFFKYSNNEEVLFENVDLKKRNSTYLSDIKLDLLYPDGKLISSEKKKDLLDLLPFIPPVYHSFYTSTRDSVSVRNDLDVGHDIDSD